MDLKSLLLSSDERTVRILRRVLSDLEIVVEHCSVSDDAVRRLTRKRFEAIIVDCSDTEDAGNVLRASRAAPVNKRALLIVLVEAAVGMKGGFEMGAHFVLHKPLAVERAKASFRAVRALMKSERRRQLRVPVQVPVECQGTRRYQAQTLDLCEGGMAVQFSTDVPKERSIHYSLELPGNAGRLDIWGETAWEGGSDLAGIRFTNATEAQLAPLRNWLKNQLPELEHDDPPVVCRLTDLSPGACYLKTDSPFPKSTCLVLAVRTPETEIRATGVVRVSHAEFGMGVEFLQVTPEQQKQVRHMIEAVHACGDLVDLQVEPDSLDTASDEAVAPGTGAPTDDALLGLLRKHSQVPAEVFLQQMKKLNLSAQARAAH